MGCFIRNKTTDTYVRTYPQGLDDRAPKGKARRFATRLSAEQFMEDEAITAVYKDGVRMGEADEDKFWKDNPDLCEGDESPGIEVKYMDWSEFEVVE